MQRSSGSTDHHGRNTSLSSSSTSSSSSSSSSQVRRAGANTSPPHPDIGLELGLDHSDDEDQIEDAALLRRNDDPDAALPVPGEEDYDVERADRNRQDGSTWASIDGAWRRFGALVTDTGFWAGQGRTRREDFDRDR